MSLKIRIRSIRIRRFIIHKKRSVQRKINSLVLVDYIFVMDPHVCIRECNTAMTYRSRNIVSSINARHRSILTNVLTDAPSLPYSLTTNHILLLDRFKLD